MSTLPNQSHVQLRRLVQETVGDVTGINTQVSTNTANIATNTANIAANTAAIAALSTAGWAMYDNTAADVEVWPEFWTEVPNNKNTSTETYLPAGVTQLLDANGYFDLTDLAVGDTVIICPNVYLTTTVLNATVRFRYSYGTATTREFIFRQDTSCSYDLGPNLNFVLPISSTAIRDNPVILEVWSNEVGTVGCNSHVIQVIET